MAPSNTQVFIVDDHPLVREWLSNLLRQSSNLEVTGTAPTSRKGLRAMLASPPDVAIVDLSLQKSSGLELIKEIAEQLPSVRVVILSMHEEIDYVERAVRAGARGYVTKRESTEQIVEAVREVASGQFFASRPILSHLTERMVSSNTQGEVDSLSDRELEVFVRLGSGHSTRRIAKKLHLSIKTVLAYCARIKEKLGHEDAVELVRDAIRWGDRRDQAG
ncbi:MAG: response regulator transcription factor [Candidatus Synoicihabitans palmerolidicus]|nr:response regulator transcription factor [Candidatus Synoicihabitans palmerolidicus]